MTIIESERKFLIKLMPSLVGLIRLAIEQHYITKSPNPLRIRRKGNMYEQTKKTPVKPGDKSRQVEVTVLLRKDEFIRLRRLSLKHLVKTRYLIKLPGGLTAELDVFGGKLKGLVWVEVEFKNEAQRKRFVPPSWFGHEVTNEKWASNSWLAGKSFKQLKPLLKK